MTQPADTLQAVTVVADRGVVVSRTDTVKIQPLLDVGSSLLYFPGLYVGDYGGLAGLKSASLRGLGSAHTAIYLDGIRVGNVQSGQADLGFIDLQSMENVVVDYAQNSLSFNTARPVFVNGRPVSGTVRFNAGSFSTWQPYGRVNFRLNERMSISAYAGGVITKGDFPLEDGTRRLNNDLKQIKAGMDYFADIKGGDIHAKLLYHGSDRGTPGSVSWPSTDRQTDRNFLAQAMLRKSFTPVYTLNLNAKGSYDQLLYKSEWGDSDYNQTEFQINSAHKFRIMPWWEVSLAADFSYDGLKSNLYNQKRLGTVWAAATAFRTARFKADLAVEYAGVFDLGGSSWNSISPSADVRFTIVPGLDILAFGRRAYRTPTFNELYYPGYGDPQLKPEDAWLTDLGLDFHRTFGGLTLEARVDGYYNYLTNKIISAPSADDPNIWLPYNVGKVQAVGADVLVGANYLTDGGWLFGCTVRYGYQNAVDKTPDSYTFDQTIPYVAKHSVLVNPVVGWKGWKLGVNWNLRAGRRDSVGEMPNWNTLDAQLAKEFRFAGCVLELSVMGRNLTDCRYDMVSGYPMPGRSVIGGISFAF